MPMALRQKQLLLSCLLTAASVAAAAQTEFPKEFIAHLKLSTGLISRPSSPGLFVGSLQVIPQYTLVPHRLRGGLVAGAFYSARKGDGLLGPTVSLKLSEFTGGYFGSLGNLHLNAEHLWGSNSQRLVGGGLNLDLLNKLIVGLSYHRDYHFGSNWWQSAIAFRLSKVKKPKETFPN